MINYLRQKLNTSIIGAISYALTCRLSDGGRPTGALSGSVKPRGLSDRDPDDAELPLT